MSPLSRREREEIRAHLGVARRLAREPARVGPLAVELVEARDAVGLGHDGLAVVDRGVVAVDLAELRRADRDEQGRERDEPARHGRRRAIVVVLRHVVRHVVRHNFTRLVDLEYMKSCEIIY